METIKFSSLEELHNNSHYYDQGFESKLYRYIYGNEELLFKEYYDYNRIKLDKIEKISSLKTEALVKPKVLLQVNDEILGFGMDFKRGYYPLSIQKKFLTPEQKYNLIIKIKNILLSLRRENCVYGDLNLMNILTNGDDVCLCDAVNMKVENYGFDEISSTMREYIERAKTTDGIDFYMLNLLTVYLFNDMEYEDIINSVLNAVTCMFNGKPLEKINFVTDTMDTLNMCCDIFLSNKATSTLLIDEVSFDKHNIAGKKI